MSPLHTLLVSVFWRFQYDVTLGYLMRRQSNGQVLTRWVESLDKPAVASSFSYVRAFWKGFVDFSVRKATGKEGDDNGGVSADDDGEEDEGEAGKKENKPRYPAAFKAWVLFRIAVDIVLPNDVVAFCVAVLRFGLLQPAVGIADGATTTAGALFASSDFLNDILRLVGKYPSRAECDISTSICLNPMVACPIGLLLIGASLLSKKKSHDVIGAYSWYWGDFFFKLERNLIFDGIFEMVPHPMYSVGYAWMYGAALLSNSFVVFGLALFSHAMQMLFLIFVETPHIEKIYGSPTNLADRSKSNIMLFRHFDIFRSSDLALALVVLLTVLLFALGIDWDPSRRTCGGEQGDYANDVYKQAVYGRPCVVDSWTYQGTTHDTSKGACTLHEWNEWYCATSLTPEGELFEWGYCNCGRIGMYAVVGHVLFWRLLRTLVSGFVLDRQAKTKWWSSRAKSVDAAFDSWKQLSNLLTTMCGVSFLIASVYLYEPLDATTAGAVMYWTAAEIFCVLGGGMLIWLNHWSNCEVEGVIGEFGWFFGDFFYEDGPPDGVAGVDCELSYSGIYRYLNNPDALFGFAGFYGIALICHSWTLAFLAAFAQILNLGFIYLVEIPHTKRMHKARYRSKNPTLRRVTDTATRVRRTAAATVHKIRDRAESAAEDIVDTIAKKVSSIGGEEVEEKIRSGPESKTTARRRRTTTSARRPRSKSRSRTRRGKE
eukprot:g5034.t1